MCIACIFALQPSTNNTTQLTITNAQPDQSRMKKFASLILALGLSLAAFAQNPTLRGVVLDSASQPVVGAFVVEQGTANGTITGTDGSFSLTTPRGAAVEISVFTSAAL